jgi:hypothetical protein
MDGQNYWLWIAYEPNTYTFVFVIFHIYIHIHIYIYIYIKRKNDFVCYQFFKQIRTKFGKRKPIYTDGAYYWYDNICI